MKNGLPGLLRAAQTALLGGLCARFIALVYTLLNPFQHFRLKPAHPSLRTNSKTQAARKPTLLLKQEDILTGIRNESRQLLPRNDPHPRVPLVGGIPGCRVAEIP